MGLHMPGWPGGDPGELRSAASAWRQLSTALREGRAMADTAVAGLSSTWEGPAAQHFSAMWHQFSTGVGNGADNLERFAGSVDQAADTLQAAHDKYERMVEMLAASVVVGIGLSFVTFGASDVAEAADAAFTASELGSVIAELGFDLDAIGEVVGSIAEFLYTFAVNFAISFAESALENRYVTGKWEWGKDLEMGAFGGLSAGIVGAVMPDDPVGLEERMLISGASGLGTDSAEQLLNIFVLKSQQGFDLYSVFESGAIGVAGGVGDPGSSASAASPDSAGSTEGSAASPMEATGTDGGVTDGAPTGSNLDLPTVVDSPSAEGIYGGQPNAAGGDVANHTLASADSSGTVGNVEPDVLVGSALHGQTGTDSQVTPEIPSDRR